MKLMVLPLCLFCLLLNGCQTVKFDGKKFSYSEINAVKTSWDDLYTQDSPIGYFVSLASLDYQIPEHATKSAKPVINALKRLRQKNNIKVVDVGSSYGINSALLLGDLRMPEIIARYSTDKEKLGRDALIDRDRELVKYGRQDLFIVGVDISTQAVKYGLETGLLSSAVTTDLELEPLSHQDISALNGADLIMTSGCVGYVTEKTFRKIMEAQSGKKKPWVLSLVLRMFPYEAIKLELERYGLRTEKLEGVCFKQRRFHDDQERIGAIQKIEELGLNLEDGTETSGYYCAELFLSRPAEEASASLEELVVHPPQRTDREIAQTK